MFLVSFSDSKFIDNHDIISLKLYQLTVLQSKKEEEEEEEEITIPSVDNIELLRCKTHTHTLLLNYMNPLLSDVTLFLSPSLSFCCLSSLSSITFTVIPPSILFISHLTTYLLPLPLTLCSRFQLDRPKNG